MTHVNGMCLKVLLTPREAACIMQRPFTSAEIQQDTGAMVNISSEYSLYPGTPLRELCITAPTIEAVLEATGQCLTKILHVLGTITGGKAGVKEGDCCVRVAVPCKVARAIVGPRGANIKQMQEETEMSAMIHEAVFPIGPES